MTAFAEQLLLSGLASAAAAGCLAFAAFMATRIWRRPALAHALWLIVLLKFISPTVVRLPIFTVVELREFSETASAVPQLANHDAALGGTIAADIVAAESSDEAATGIAPTIEALRAAPEDIVESRIASRWPVFSVPSTFWTTFRNWSRPLLLMWLTGSVAYFAQVAIRLRRLARLLGRTRPADDNMQAEVAAVAGRLRLARLPSARMTTAVAPPFVWSLFGRSWLVLPVALLEQLTRDELRTLLAHELAHLKRRDHQVRWLELLVLGLFWWQPVAWLVTRKVQHAAEECCDALVVRRFPRHAHAYARALFKAVDFLASETATAPVAGVAFGQAYLIQRRFEMILSGRAKDRLPRASALLVTLVGLAALGVSIGSLRADEPTPVTSAAAESVDSAAQSSAENANASDIEARLRRLEQTVQSMRESEKARPAAAAPPNGREASDRVARDLELLGVSGAIAIDFDKKPADPFNIVLKSVEEQAHRLQTNKHRVLAAEKNLEAVQKAYDNGKVTLDLLLDAQRRSLIAQVEYIDTTFRLAGFLPDRDRKQAQARLSLEAYVKGRDAALATWRHVKGLYDTNSKGGEAENEAQAREQYFLLRDQTETAVRQVQEAR